MITTRCLSSVYASTSSPAGTDGRRLRELLLGEILERAVLRRGRHTAWMSIEQIRSNRPTHQSARDDADHAGGHGECGCTWHSGLLEERRERQTGRRAAGQRHRSGQHAHQRMLAEEIRDRRAEHVLQCGDERGHDHHQQHQRPATLEQQHAGAKSNRCEERVLQRRLQRGVEGERPPCQRHSAIANSAATGRPPATGAGML